MIQTTLLDRRRGPPPRSCEPFRTVRCFLYILCYVCDSGGTVTADSCDSPAFVDSWGLPPFSWGVEVENVPILHAFDIGNCIADYSTARAYDFISYKHTGVEVLIWIIIFCISYYITVPYDYR